MLQPFSKTVDILSVAPLLTGAQRRRLALLNWAGRNAVVLVATFVALMALVPLAFVALITVQTGWQTAYELIFRTRVAELLVNTVLLEVLTLPLAIVLATALAWITERSDLPGARLWSWLAVAPLGIPAFVHAYGWISVMPRMGGLMGALLISVLAYFPFLYLPIAAQLRRLDPVIEDSAASLGLGPSAVFFRVILPQLRLAICGGSLLVGLHLLAEYGLYAMIQFDTFSTAIVDQFQSAFNGPAANMLSGVLVIACILLLRTEIWLRGSERYARVGKGAPKPVVRIRLGRWTPSVLLIPVVTAMLSVGVPLLTLLRWLAFGGADVWPLAEIGSALWQTIGVAGGGALVATLLALPMAWLSVRRPSRLQRVLEACHYYVGALPGVVVALALVTLTVRVALPLYQTWATLILAYALLFLPRTLVGLRASIAQAPVELERAAAALGHKPFQAFLHVTLRLSAPGVAVGFALSALGIMTELTATLMLAPNGMTTLATRFWSLSGEIDYAGAAPYALMMVLLSLPLTVLLHNQSRRSIGQ